MPGDWGDEFQPSRAALEREAWEEEQERTYEGRFQEFCWAHHLDPEDVGSVIEYEEFYNEQPNDGGSAGWGYV